MAQVDPWVWMGGGYDLYGGLKEAAVGVIVIVLIGLIISFFPPWRRKK